MSHGDIHISQAQIKERKMRRRVRALRQACHSFLKDEKNALTRTSAMLKEGKRIKPSIIDTICIIIYINEKENHMSIAWGSQERNYNNDKTLE